MKLTVNNLIGILLKVLVICFLSVNSVLLAQNKIQLIKILKQLNLSEKQCKLNLVVSKPFPNIENETIVVIPEIAEEEDTDGSDLKSEPSVNFRARIKIYCYRKSLQDCINPLIENGFSISKLIEPKPVKEFKKLDPKHYEELNQFLDFMCIKAENN